MAKFLIVYATEEGQSQKISEFMAGEIRSQGHEVEIHNCNEHNIFTGTINYAGILIGGSIHKSQFSEILTNWIKNNSALISKIPSAFFSVCLGILEKGAIAQDEERQIVINFFDEVSWYPRKTAIFAGALKYSKYGWFTKWMMKKIVEKAGGATDTSKDYEYTDWKAVSKFTTEFIKNALDNKETVDTFKLMSNPKRIFS